MKILDNAHPTKNWITNTVAVILFTISIFMFIAPYIYERADNVEWYMPVITMCLGFVALFIPDTFAKDIPNIIDDFVKQKKDNNEV